VVKRLFQKLRRREEASGGESAYVALARLAFNSGREGVVDWETWVGLWDKTLTRSVRDKTVGGNDVESA